MVPEGPKPNFFERLSDGFINMFEAPANYFREKIVLPNRGEPYPWYHMKYRRVPEIDQCFTDDYPCVYEAEQQFIRDRKVDHEVTRILRKRRDDCILFERPDHEQKCAKVTEDFQQAELNLFIKYGDMGIKQNARNAYMKQKHRMVFERRKATGFVPNPVTRPYRPEDDFD